MSEIIKESNGWDTDKNGKRWEDYETIVCPDGQVIDMVDLLNQQSSAMAALTHLAPMFGGFVGKLRFIYTFRVKTQATDGYNILVNPQFTANLDFTGKVFVMAHEIMHCLLNHLRRGRGHNPQQSNIAADYEVNDTLVEMGLFKSGTITKLGALWDPKFNGWGYEAIYDKVTAAVQQSMDNQAQQQQAAQNNDQRGEGEGQGGSGGAEQKSADYKAGWAKAVEEWFAKNKNAKSINDLT